MLWMSLGYVVVAYVLTIVFAELSLTVEALVVVSHRAALDVHCSEASGLSSVRGPEDLIEEPIVYHAMRQFQEKGLRACVTLAFNLRHQAVEIGHQRRAAKPSDHPQLHKLCIAFAPPEGL